MSYRYRATSTDSDTDLYEILSLTYGNPEQDSVTAALSVRLAEDLDGNRNVQGYYPFTSSDDARRSFATQRLYTAYVDFRTSGRESGFRAGRQILEEFPEAVVMDGCLARVQIGPRVAVTAFGGIPDNLFEPSPAGDAMYGASAEWLPDRGRYRLEYLHIRDDNVFGLHKDDLLACSVDERWGPFGVHARYAVLEGESRDVVGRLTGALPDAEFLFQVQGTYVFHQIGVLSYALDPYSSFLMNLQPYFECSVRASKGFGETFSIDAAFTARELVRDAPETTYNHEFKRVEIAPVLRNWPLDALTIRISADYWNSSTIDFWTVSGDLSWALHRDITLSAGSSYALYAVDAFTGEERDRVRTYSLGLKWRVSKGSSIDVRFMLEDSEIGTFRVFEFGFRHAF